MSQHRVTAVIPLHNHAQWVRDAVASVDRQDYPEKRIVVVDNGSTDGSLAAAASALLSGVRVNVDGLAHPPAEVYRGKHRDCGTEVWLLRYPEAKGPSFARNRGIELGGALGCDYFAFLDSDDLYQPGKIAKSVARFLACPAVGAVYSDFDTLRPDGLRVREWKEPFSRERLVRECIVNCDSLVSAAAIQAVDGFDEDMRVCEDYDLWMRVSEKFLISHIPESLVTVRVGPHSSTATVKSEVWQANWRRVMEKARQRQHA